MVSLQASVHEHASSGSKFHTKQTDAAHAESEPEEPEEPEESEEPEPWLGDGVPFPVP